MCRPCARRKSPRAPSLRFIERRVSGDRPVRSVCRSHLGGLRRGVHGHRASAFVKTMQSTSKTIGSKARESPRAACETTFSVCPRRWLRSLYRSLASSADFRPGRGRNVRACMVPSASAARLIHFARFVSLRPPRPRRNSWSQNDEAKTRWPNGNARTLPLVYRIRSEFRNRKLQETRPRCRLERRIEPRATRIVDVRATLFFASLRPRLTPLCPR